MTRRDWIVALALGPGLSLLVGCTSARLAATAQSGLPEVIQDSSVPLPAPSGPASSPYRVLPTPTAQALAVPPVQPDRQAVTSSPTAGTVTDPPVQLVSQLPASSKSEDPSAVQVAAAQERTFDQALSVPELQPDTPEPAVITALRYLLDRRPADAMRVLKKYDQPTQDLLFCLLPLAARLTEESMAHADQHELAIWVEQLDGVVGAMRRRAALGLDRMCFCRRIERFGVYEPLPQDHPFSPGEQVQMYVELRNVSCEQRDSFYETRLSSSVRLTRLVDGKEQIEWEQGFPDRFQGDRSQAPRHDYFNNYRFCIPANIPLGAYTLYLRVIDVPTKRIAEQRLPLRLSTRPGS